MPATLWIMLTSSASLGGRSGSRPGSRAASIDLPEPGGPIIRRLCPPAAATSRARFAVSWPLISLRSSGTAGAEEEIEASRRALERAEAIVHAELKRGLAGLATIGSTAPFVGLFGTVVGILNAFKGISGAKATGLAAVAGGISEALVTTAIGLFVAIPAVWMFNYFTGRVEAFDVEMENSSSELIDYFLKRRNVRR